MTDEQQGQLEWLKDLKQSLIEGDTESAIEAVGYAIELLEKNENRQLQKVQPRNRVTTCLREV